MQTVSNNALNQIYSFFAFPRNWGYFKDGRWTRSKRENEKGEWFFDCLNEEQFTAAMRSGKAVHMSISNIYEGSCNNMQSFCVFDADNAENPIGARQTIIRIANVLDQYTIYHLPCDSGGKGAHLFVIWTASIYSGDVQKFMERILIEADCIHSYDLKIVTDLLIKNDRKRIPTAEELRKNIKDKAKIEHVQNLFSKGILTINTQPAAEKITSWIDPVTMTEIETRTELGDGGMIRIPCSPHPTKSGCYSVPMTIKRMAKIPHPYTPTDKDWRKAEKLLGRLKRNDYRRILDIAEIDNPIKADEIRKKTSLRSYTEFESRFFTIPPKSPEMDAKAEKILQRINDVPCLKWCYEQATTRRGIFWPRANLVTSLAKMGFSREEISYFFRYHINDEIDNANRGILQYQVAYWHQRKHHCRCSYFQEAGKKHCCFGPCGRCDPWQVSGEVIRAHLIKSEDWKVFQICKDIITSEKKLVLAPKTTRAGFTTAFDIVAVQMGLRTLFLEPRTAITEDTFTDTILLAYEKYGLDIKGFVISANQKYCLQRSLESVEYKKRFNKKCRPGMPIPKSSCNKCRFKDSEVVTDPHEPLIESSREELTCAYATFMRHKDEYTSGKLTYSKLNTLINTTSSEAQSILSDFQNYDIIVMDEVSHFVENPYHELELYHEGENKEVLSFFHNLDEAVNLLYSTHRGETVENIVILSERFKQAYSDFSQYHDTDKVKNFLSDQERVDLNIRMIDYIETLYVSSLDTEKSLAALYSMMVFLTEASWYVSIVRTQEYQKKISFIIPPKNKDIIRFLKATNAQIVMTDATLPFQRLDQVFESPITEITVGDPRETAKTQLVIADTTSIPPNRLFIDSERLERFVDAVSKTHGHKNTLFVLPNIASYKRFLHKFEKIKKINVTYFRSNATIGVACPYRIMVTLSSPYPPKNAFDWMSVDLVGNTSISSDLWHTNARNTYFQSIGRAKDPFGKTTSVVYTYGQTKHDVTTLIDDCVGLPMIVQCPVMREPGTTPHVIIGDFWMRTGICFQNENELRVLICHQLGKKNIRRELNLGSDFVDNVLTIVESAYSRG